MNKLKALVFDFDGVILDSSKIKISAYKEIFERYPNYVDEMMQYSLHNAGLSRYIQFKHFFVNVMGVEYDSITEKNVLNEFAEKVISKVLKAPFIDGVMQFIKSCRIKGYKTYIATGIPQDEIMYIAKKRNIIDDFDAIYGSPERKESIIKRIISENKLLCNEIMFFGDAMSDYESAMKCNIKFTGVGNLTVFPEDVIRIDNFLKSDHIQIS